MGSHKLTSDGAVVPQAEELFEMANLYPRTAGLPMTVWVGPRGNARYDQLAQMPKPLPARG